MPPALDLHGTRFGRLVAEERAQKDRHHAWMWRCRCDCGASVVVRGATLQAGRTMACASCASSARNITHGKSKSALYGRWRSMLSRVANPRQRGFANYGGRGISVCPRWRQFEAFEADMGATFDPQLELDRINVDGDYEPENCRWATRAEQCRNMRSNHSVTWAGQTMTVTDWAQRLGIKPNTLICRLRRNWPLDRALTKDASPTVLTHLLQLANGTQQ